MKRTMIVLTCLLTVGCATNYVPDGYVQAAQSWQGGRIKDMIAAWGHPNDSFVEPSDYMHGMAQWRYEETPEPNPFAEVKNETTCTGAVANKHGAVSAQCTSTDANQRARENYEFGRQVGLASLRKCHVVVEFDDSGTIFSVVAKSKHCTPRDPKILDALFRPGAKETESSE